MKPLFLCISMATMLLAQTGCEGQRISGSGNLSREERQLVGAYHKVELRGDMDVYFTQGPAAPAVIEAEDNLLPYIELVEEDGALVVRTKPGVRISHHKDIKVTLTAPDVRALSLAGSGNIQLMNTLTSREQVNLSLAGSGDITGVVNAPSVKASISGSGNIKTGGETRNLQVSIAGSGDFEGKELLSENADINIAGSGDAAVHASVELDAKIAGSGNVTYKGSPKVSAKTMGSGRVEKD